MVQVNKLQYLLATMILLVILLASTIPRTEADHWNASEISTYYSDDFNKGDVNSYKIIELNYTQLDKVAMAPVLVEYLKDFDDVEEDFVHMLIGDEPKSMAEQDADSYDPDELFLTFNLQFREIPLQNERIHSMFIRPVEISIDESDTEYMKFLFRHGYSIQPHHPWYINEDTTERNDERTLTATDYTDIMHITRDNTSIIASVIYDTSNGLLKTYTIEIDNTLMFSIEQSASLYSIGAYLRAHPVEVLIGTVGLFLGISYLPEILRYLFLILLSRLKKDTNKNEQSNDNLYPSQDE